MLIGNQLPDLVVNPLELRSGHAYCSGLGRWQFPDLAGLFGRGRSCHQGGKRGGNRDLHRGRCPRWRGTRQVSLRVVASSSLSGEGRTPPR